MTVISDNCCICGEEFSCDELKGVALSAVNITKFKICNGCLNKSNPADDYRQVREIVMAYLNLNDKL